MIAQVEIVREGEKPMLLGSQAVESVPAIGDMLDFPLNDGRLYVLKVVDAAVPRDPGGYFGSNEVLVTCNVIMEPPGIAGRVTEETLRP